MNALLAQITNGLPVDPPDVDLSNPEVLVLLLSPFVGALATALVKKVAPKIPKLLIPITATALGTLSAWLATQAVGDAAPFWLSVAVGLASIGVREIVDRFGKATGMIAAKASVILATLLPFSVLTVPLLGTGCSTLSNPDNVRRVASVSKVAAYVGTTTSLIQHPEWRPAFVTAAVELRVLEEAETIDFATLLAIIDRLPVDELKSPEARIFITGATLVLSEFGSELRLDQLESLRPVVKAIREGIELGLIEPGGTNQLIRLPEASD